MIFKLYYLFTTLFFMKWLNKEFKKIDYDHCFWSVSDILYLYGLYYSRPKKNVRKTIFVILSKIKKFINFLKKN